jgi:hypothetical protein
MPVSLPPLNVVRDPRGERNFVAAGQMLPPGDSTRELLPHIAAAPEDILGSEMPFGGGFVIANDVASLSHQPASQTGGGPLAAEPEHGTQEDDSGGSDANIPLGDAASSSTGSLYSTTLVMGPEGNQFVTLSTLNGSSPEPSEIGDGIGAGRSVQSGGGQGPAEPNADDARTGEIPGDSGSGADANGDAHSVSVSQIAVVDQEASLIVNGYAGAIVARLSIDQDILMDQEVDIDIAIDDGGHFNIMLDQEVRIDQDVEIDLKIFDIDGVLYIEMVLHDSVEVEQSTTVDLQIGDGPPGGTVEINQDIEMDQDVDIDLDIEDDLEERYEIGVNIETLQVADVDQIAAIDIAQWSGGIDLDVTATQTAAIEQHTTIEVDFAMV